MSIFFLEATWYILPHHSKLEDPAKLWQTYDMWEILCCVEKNTREADGQSNGENRCSPYGHSENWNWNDIDWGLAMLFKCWAMPNKIRTLLFCPSLPLSTRSIWREETVRSFICKAITIHLDVARNLWAVQKYPQKYIVGNEIPVVRYDAKQPT